MGVESVFPRTVFSIGPVPISDTVLHTWIVVLALIGLAWWAHRRFRVWEPRTWQLAIEYLVDYVETLVVDSGGRAWPELVSYLTTMIAFIAIANLLGLAPVLQSPTRDLNTTAALSIVSLVSTHYFAARKNGLRANLRRFIEPVALLLPLNLMGEFSRVISMALRLFGNVVASEIVAAVMFMLVPLFSPLLLNMLGMITGVLQALVFMFLTLVFTLDAMGSDEPETGKEI